MERAGRRRGKVDQGGWRRTLEKSAEDAAGGDNEAVGDGEAEVVHLGVAGCGGSGDDLGGREFAVGRGVVN